ncbi:sulfurtransferase-like selenium metabolism protein YedF [Caballeronia sp. ATUFL_M1_KS5A]|uniref:sulfurtransferase-like selenium metabolism protein YedF n=1 Tax=Caballeronia sp. ATUFL_M1_KS5A TaxID=2921778 RepID=UPI00253FF26E|nr:sulfurtransferase-like selenium metabolism protein YedF [Caballeronia sp. ATUFL_M1_KS5A]
MNVQDKFPDFMLDLRGEPCPYPAVATIQAMRSLKTDEVLEVLSDCPQSIHSIPADARKLGYTVLRVQQAGPTITYWLTRPATQ